MSEASGFKYCDVVMKGGITSGIVYPRAASELAKEFKFKNIGGTSAGAIAAALTAAAEYGRRSGNANAFDLVEGLPAQLGSNDLLLKLFQPSPSTAPIFRIVIAALRPKATVAKLIAAAGALLRTFWMAALSGAVLGGIVPALLFLLFWRTEPGVRSIWIYLVLSLLWILLGSIVAILISAIKTSVSRISNNGFGLVGGFDPEAADGEPPLVNWLHHQIQQAAGRKSDDDPLTFEDLWNAQPFAGEQLKTDHAIHLEVVTSNLTQGRPFTIPFESDTFFFDEAEFSRLFPRLIVDWMLKHPRPTRNDKHRVQSPEGRILHPMPAGEQLPILVATRMSLSFPILLSAVPLYAVDFTLQRNDNVPDGGDLAATRCWFSDGGISSNFPIQFFDSPLPRWPTFGMTLKAPHPDHSQNEADFVWLPPGGSGRGSQLTMNEFDIGSAAHKLLGFFGAIANTAQNWRDNTQAIAAGYRDRIVQISLRPNEGGLNLTMPPELLKTLSDRGSRAGQLLRDNFDFPLHLWSRFRITMGAIENYLDQLHESWTNPVPQDSLGRSYITGEVEPLHYKVRSAALAELLREALELLVQISGQWQTRLDTRSFSDNSPRPEAVLRAQPKF